MLFSSPVFLFAFLPLVLAAYSASPRALRNTLLLGVSLLFYAWGEVTVVLVMLASIAANWGFGLWLERAMPLGKGRRVVVVAALFNIGMLVLFKYADWMWDGLSALLVAAGAIGQPLPRLGRGIDQESWLGTAFLTSDGGIRLPIGISFFTFQAFSYVLDVYRRDAPVQRNPGRVALYVALFPQLIAGPIVRYRDVAAQIVQRVVTLEGFAEGIRRFVIGLGKKVLIANTCGHAADQVFGAAGSGLTGIPPDELHPAVAWLGITAYTLQIYFDFSGYSDMAIGLGRMFGFRFLEN
jgi:alginate O-acetyltransferase complex protein AlgI